MAEETQQDPQAKPAVNIPDASATFEEHRQGIIGAFAKRFLEQLYFRNILAVAMVFTMCWKELQGESMSEHFYMLAALVVGMYFPSGERK